MGKSSYSSMAKTKDPNSNTGGGLEGTFLQRRGSGGPRKRRTNTVSYQGRTVTSPGATASHLRGPVTWTPADKDVGKVQPPPTAGQRGAVWSPRGGQGGTSESCSE